jgi:hypothetical protein
VQLVEMGAVVVDELGAVHEVARQAAQIGRIGLEAIIQGADGSQGVHLGAHAACALGDVRCVAGITAFKNNLQAAEQLGGTPGVLYLAALNLHIDAQVALDASNWIDGVFSHLLSPPSGSFS